MKKSLLALSVGILALVACNSTADVSDSSTPEPEAAAAECTAESEAAAAECTAASECCASDAEAECTDAAEECSSEAEVCPVTGATIEN